MGLIPINTMLGTGRYNDMFIINMVNQIEVKRMMREEVLSELKISCGDICNVLDSIVDAADNYDIQSANSPMGGNYVPQQRTFNDTWWIRKTRKKIKITRITNKKWWKGSWCITIENTKLSAEYMKKYKYWEILTLR